MDRLTDRSVNGKAVYRHPTPEPEGWEVNRSAVLERCCQYEDTGLTPEEIMDGKMLTGWIPVAEQLPVDDTDVIVCKSDGIINIAFWSGDAWMSLDSNYTLNVFAWMPLPEPYNPQN